VNADRRESDLTPIPAETLALWGGGNGGPSTHLAEANESEPVPQSLWRYVLIALLIVAAIESWLADRVQANHLDAPKVLTAYRNAVQIVAKDNYSQAGAEFSTLTGAFAQTGIQLMPQPYPPMFTSDWKLWTWPWEWRWSGVWSWPADHLFGILTSAALLSLGAPFWFNTLKSLANLRPLLADQIGQEQKAKAAAAAGQ